MNFSILKYKNNNKYTKIKFFYVIVSVRNNIGDCKSIVIIRNFRLLQMTKIKNKKEIMNCQALFKKNFKIFDLEFWANLN